MPIKKEDLRKVKISSFEGSQNFDKKGYFHEWANCPEFHENGTFQNTLAIVEHEDGIIKNYKPSRLKFVDEF